MNIRSIARAGVFAVLAAAAMGVSGGLASAQPPVVTPPAGDYTIHIPASLTPCGSFTIGVHDGERYTTFYDNAGTPRVIGVNGALSYHITSDLTGRSADVNIPGPGKLLTNGDAILTGPMFLFAPHTFAFVHGRAYLPGFDPDQAIIVGQRIDYCPILVG